MEDVKPFNRDEEHLRLLKIFYYIFSGITAFQASIPLIHVAIGIIILIAAVAGGGEERGPPAFVGIFFVCLGGAIVLIGWTLAICAFFSARCLSRRTAYVFCFAIAVMSCLCIPYGTVLGIFTIIVLVRPSVKTIFERTRALQNAPAAMP
jgi:ABC-type transport system involved in multi-copper enzyme maturation permease subunit